MEEKDSVGAVVEKWSNGKKTQFAIGRYAKNKYQDDFPERFIEFCKKGASVAEFCGQIGIAKDTFYEYCKQYPEMAEARKIGKTIAESWWASMGREHLVIHNHKDDGKNTFNQRLYEYTMGGRFGYSSDRKTRLLIEELLRRTQTLAAKTDDVIASEPEYEQLQNQVVALIEQLDADKTK